MLRGLAARLLAKNKAFIGYVMTDSWNLASLHAYIDTLEDQDKGFLLTDFVNSVGMYMDIHRYHLATARDAMKGILNEDDPSSHEKNMAYAFGSAERQHEYNFAKIVNEANLLACIHSTRAVYDVFSQLLNELLLQGAISTEKCEIRSVTRRLASSPLKTELEGLITSYWFGYASAFINTAKHRRLVRHGYRISFDGEKSGLCLGAFEYGGVKYQSYLDYEVLKGTLEIKNRIVACGIALNIQVFGFN